MRSARYCCYVTLMRDVALLFRCHERYAFEIRYAPRFTIRDAAVNVITLR